MQLRKVNKLGKLIVIEGLDGTGKSTQLDVLFKRLTEEGTDCKSVSFPNYNSPACEPVKMYLNGAFGTDANAVNPYAASSFYAVDRFASYKENWGEYYNNGGTVICGRYTTSNAIHQCSKIDSKDWDSFLSWLYDYEYNKLGIPQPDLVIFLNMSTEISDTLLNKRYSGDESKKDIHENNVEYLKKCREAAQYTAKFSGWKTVECVNENGLRSIEDISNEIYSLFKELK